MARDGRGWFKESARHSQAAKGIKSGRKRGARMPKHREMSMEEMEKRGLMFWAGKDRTYYLRRASVGKFEGGYFINRYVYSKAYEWEGEIEATGVFSPLVFDEEFVRDVQKEMSEDGESLTLEERDFLRDMYGAIPIENNVGFVEIEYFETKAEMESVRNQMQAEIEEFYEEQEEEFGEDFF